MPVYKAYITHKDGSTWNMTFTAPTNPFTVMNECLPLIRQDMEGKRILKEVRIETLDGGYVTTWKGATGWVNELRKDEGFIDNQHLHREKQ